MPVPRHRQLSEMLKDHILSGQYEPGDMLPSEHALCEVHSVTRPTVRQALNTLVAEGLIRKHKGKGSIVQPRRGGIGILNIVGTTDSMPAGTITTRVLDKPRAAAWPSDFGHDLYDHERASGCVRFTRLRELDGDPVFVEQTFLPNINLPRFEQRKLHNKSLFRLLDKHYGITVTSGEQRIWADTPSEQIACTLDCATDDPILRLEKCYLTNRGDYRFFTRLWCNTSQYYLMGSL